MPVYEWECTNTDRCESNTRYEKEFPINADQELECPLCHEPMRKIYSSFGISFKGSGFYSTDSK
jgi:putative FmdB family regulatory protein